MSTTLSPCLPGTMLEGHVHHPLRVTLHRVASPQPHANEVLIKVHVSGSNPKDWKRPFWHARYNGTNQGDDIAGVVAAVGSAVTQFKPGDRVAGLHELDRLDAATADDYRATPRGGSYAEYALSPEHTTFHIPAHVSFEEAATIPLAAMTAALGLFVHLGLPEPWVGRAHPTKLPKGGLLIYGAASAVGAYAVQLAKRAGIHPIIAVAGQGIPFVEDMLDHAQGDVVVDYRQGNEGVVRDIKAALPPGQQLRYAFDAVSELAKSSYINICRTLAPDEAWLTLVLPGAQGDGLAIPPSVHTSWTWVSSAHQDDKDFGYAWFRLFELGLKEGWFKPHPHQVVPGGLKGLEQALQILKDGKASATKYVFRISETKELNEPGS